MNFRNSEVKNTAVKFVL